MSKDWNLEILKEWRDLNFYYKTDENSWYFYGSRKGIQNLSEIIYNYSQDELNIEISEHEHLGWYEYLKIVTWDKPTIQRDGFYGTLDNLKELSLMIKNKLIDKVSGDSFSIDNEYGIDNSFRTKFTIMDDSFDPASLDKNLTN